MCDNAEHCARQVLSDKRKDKFTRTLESELESIRKLREESVREAKQSQEDTATASRFNFRRPNTRESWLVAELGYDPFQTPTNKDYEEMAWAERRINYRRQKLESLVR
jgi:hypothetical protein